MGMDGVYNMLYAGIFYFVMFLEYMEKSRIMMLMILFVVLL